MPRSKPQALSRHKPLHSVSLFIPRWLDGLLSAIFNSSLNIYIMETVVYSYYSGSATRLRYLVKLHGCTFSKVYAINSNGIMLAVRAGI